ncbi:LOW QUALITY PROTEIN: hypothetical protein ColTof4_04665 [Colletotrichum tofieldiae]|nr:LOW QUALITY PROTEIN: hypothetical protein ColTof3_11092 [Colletotrichum tofieldiae]GKT72242.1 LOW QUALITY PROTEIN: hypothetical protein ColTof4_04665 [Colletotrichum tofieldiae]
MGSRAGPSDERSGGREKSIATRLLVRYKATTRGYVKDSFSETRSVHGHDTTGPLGLPGVQTPLLLLPMLRRSAVSESFEEAPWRVLCGRFLAKEDATAK